MRAFLTAVLLALPVAVSAQAPQVDRRELKGEPRALRWRFKKQ